MASKKHGRPKKNAETKSQRREQKKDAKRSKKKGRMHK